MNHSQQPAVYRALGKSIWLFGPTVRALGQIVRALDQIVRALGQIVSNPLAIH